MGHQVGPHVQRHGLAGVQGAPLAQAQHLTAGELYRGVGQHAARAGGACAQGARPAPRPAVPARWATAPRRRLGQAPGPARGRGRWPGPGGAGSDPGTSSSRFEPALVDSHLRLCAHRWLGVVGHPSRPAAPIIGQVVGTIAHGNGLLGAMPMQAGQLRAACGAFLTVANACPALCDQADR